MDKGQLKPSRVLDVIQGVRAFDPELGSFTTPDAFAGNIGDPMSSKPFMWDGNNPIEYSDPSGFDTCSHGVIDRNGEGDHIDVCVTPKGPAKCCTLNGVDFGDMGRSVGGMAEAMGFIVPGGFEEESAQNLARYLLETQLHHQ
jgi:RHS repeat-associated protein